ncbi:TrmB family transcriptional regulator [Methanoculleus taiwanensis]|uniref:TrmB family transcriptional regulator n=1 Tax=Methanoculleus taiwanensis TaxID=1550565 RepID=A0A498H1A6_9EURY|nr:helix-turn-helix domain-containing protein [Methanoculleus taiwanensis]RXE56134.1 TrmB family transcriptional regulator [Methanoculleus taiwanensis]
MTIAPIPQLRTLGLNEYEAKVYSTLVGLRKGTARDINRLSGVPRGRIYEILHDLARRGFIGIEEGSPNSYYVLDTDEVIDRLKEDAIRSLEEARTALKSLEVELPVTRAPWFVLRSDWAIENHFQSVFRKVQEELIVLCRDLRFLQEHERLFKQLRRRIQVSVVVSDKELFSGVNLPIYEATGLLRDFFESDLPGPEHVEMTAAFFIDAKESFFIGRSGAERLAVIGTERALIRYLAKSIAERIRE